MRHAPRIAEIDESFHEAITRLVGEGGHVTDRVGPRRYPQAHG